MKFTLFTLYPQIFESFFATSLIARGIHNKVLSFECVNWRDECGVGNHKQVDDKMFGGGSGMVLQPDPIIKSLSSRQLISCFFAQPDYPIPHVKIIPNNIRFYRKWLHNSGVLAQLANQLNLEKNQPPRTSVINLKKITISLTPRGFPFTQQIAEWLTHFDEIALLCGRFEGFDARVDEAVDIELSLGDFVLNGGEIASMAVVEAVSRLLPGFVSKTDSISHDSFSSSLNIYNEQSKYSKVDSVISKKTEKVLVKSVQELEQKLVDDIFPLKKWLEHTLPHIEHPQYTRPENWMNWVVPAILKNGDHKAIQNLRINWFTEKELEIEKSIKG